MNRSPENLGLAPDISCLSSEVRDLIHHGHHGQYPGCSEAAVAVCTEMFRAGHGIDTIWVVMSDPENGVSKAFFEKDGDQAEVWLERVVSEADEASRRRYGEGGSGQAEQQQ